MLAAGGRVLLAAPWLLFVFGQWSASPQSARPPTTRQVAELHVGVVVQMGSEVEGLLRGAGRLGRRVTRSLLGRRVADKLLARRRNQRRSGIFPGAHRPPFFVQCALLGFI